MELGKSDNLDDLLVVSVRDYIVLVPLVEAHDNEVALAESRDEEVHLLSSESHGVERLVRFISVAAALEVLVPNLERHVVRAGDELGVANLHQTLDVGGVRATALELPLHHDDVARDRDMACFF